MSREELSRQVGSLLNDAITGVYEHILAENGLDLADLEVGFPYDGDAESAFDELTDATIGILADTLSWHDKLEKE